MYNMQTTLGHAYLKNNNGKRELTDIYDYRSIPMNANWASKDYKGIHKIMENYGTPVPVNITLDNN